ncbi:hypothetical protein AVEN_23031-1 [Araneus ventricosus]|uniref:Tc1-like transposase DDE domain-containing protein n=1 Tax=Araneus ventricosus TaxID=182803 RepID=A0A4Y2LKC2_ARAVE|nr:hypothetical protein AVEN_23031-1 [Araneus ventricosus]
MKVMVILVYECDGVIPLPPQQTVNVQHYCLYHPPYSPDLSTCDFDLIPKMKEPLRGIRFRTVPEILLAIDSSIRTINTTGAATGILQLPHLWQPVVHNALH